MNHTVEHILIVHSVTGTSQEQIREANEAISSYVCRLSSVTSVIAKPLVFQIPSGVSAGATLNSELMGHLAASVGAVVFVDDLRPNIAYEIGYFHGRARRVLLVTTKAIEETWLSISDLAGSALLHLSSSSLTAGIHAYLDRLYTDLSALRPYSAPALPAAGRNMLVAIAEHPRVSVNIYSSDFGPCINIDTWGGVVFDTAYNLFPGAGFKVAARTRSPGATYSIYFKVRYITTTGERSAIALALSSKQGRLGLEANERNLPSQGLTREWRMLSGSFEDLLMRGHVHNIQRVEHLIWIRARAGNYHPDPFAKTQSYEIGFLEVTGIDG